MSYSPILALTFISFGATASFAAPATSPQEGASLLSFAEARMAEADRIAKAVESQVDLLANVRAGDGSGGRPGMEAKIAKKLEGVLSGAQRAAVSYRKAADSFCGLRDQYTEASEERRSRIGDAVNRAAEKVNGRADSLDDAVRGLVTSTERRQGKLVSEYKAALEACLDYLPETPEGEVLGRIECMVREVGIRLYGSLAQGAPADGSSRELFDTLATMGAISGTNPDGLVLPSEAAKILPPEIEVVKRRFRSRVTQLDPSIHAHGRFKRLHATWEVIRSLEDQPWTQRVTAVDHVGATHEGTVGELLTVFLEEAARLSFNENKESLKRLGRQLYFVLDEQKLLRALLVGGE